ncbi:hypothetical protein GKZ90_0018395 [Flavobacterium sp. MC2016-06]|jgi:hypothetical protein|uniref:hypothetical protein n=1 Tax=Flavobacterium sp. MC2016-06 TaxID=2676308 RepID=UPI0012BAD141|nr:hypothetical protein [Flavobacterium sp. MC2016-06]MBU3858432.1 hypothetical protein [Flavobacterium sp. MC2016-06]
MRKILVIMPLLVLGCVNKLREDRLYLKEIKAKNKIIEWFYYSNVSSTSADYVLLCDTINGKNDTVINSTNIKDVRFINDTITLFFYGKPKNYDDYLIIKKTIGDFKITIDTNSVSNGPIPSRESYLKKQ